MRCIDDAKIGERLRQLRICKSCKMIDVSIEFHISTAQYSRLEKGQIRVSADVLNKACKFYHTSIEFILFGESAAPKGGIFQKLDRYPEEKKRTALKILSCLVTADEREKEEPYYKLFMDGLLERIPISAPSALPYVLEYERERKGISENTAIRELGLSRFKWNCNREARSGCRLCRPRRYSAIRLRAIDRKRGIRSMY